MNFLDLNHLDILDILKILDHLDIKLIYSEKATNFCKISTIDLSCVVKFGFSEKATKFEENLRLTFDKSVVFCARSS